MCEAQGEDSRQVREAARYPEEVEDRGRDREARRGGEAVARLTTIPAPVGNGGMNIENFAHKNGWRYGKFAHKTCRLIRKFAHKICLEISWSRRFVI